jgi:hypothetical protein
MRKSLTATEFARLIGRDHKTVIGWVKRGLIPGAKRVGYYYQIPTKEVQAYQHSKTYPLKQWHK